jgi:nucleotide-binding universal stress UspA family protein
VVVIAAVDRSDSASKVLEEADNLAEKFGDKVHVLHVMKRSEAIKIEEESAQKNDAIPVEKLRDRAAQISEELIKDYPTDSVSEPKGLIGDPATEIVSFAEEISARYIVVSPKRRSKAGKLLFGSVAQSVLLNATCPVLSLNTN